MARQPDPYRVAHTFSNSRNASPELAAGLCNLLGLLRAQHWNYWTSHWQVMGDTFYGDHLLFERLYGAVLGEIDALAEKIVAYFGPGAVNVHRITSNMLQFEQEWQAEPNHYNRAYLTEVALEGRIKLLLEVLAGSNPGVENYLQGVLDTHQTHKYLIQQRLRSSLT